MNLDIKNRSGIVHCEDWNIQEIDSLGEIVTGTTPPTQYKSLFGDDYPFVTPGDMGSVKYITNTERGLSKDGLRFVRGIPEGALMVVCIGATIGKIALASRFLATNQQINSIIPNEDVDSEFLYYIMHTAIQDLRSRAGTTATPIVKKSEFSKIRFPIPPLLSEQRAIAAILDTVDRTITQTEQLIEKLRAIKSGLLHDLLTRGIGADGRVRDPEKYPEEFKDSEVGLIPKEWSLRKLDDTATSENNAFVDGPFGSNLKTSDYTESGIRLIQLQNVGEGEFIDKSQKFTSERKFSELIRHSAYPGDLVIAKMPDPIARACIIPPICDRFLVVADCIRLRVDSDKYDPCFVMYAINFWPTRKQAERKSTGTTRQRIGLSESKTVLIPKPPLPEQHRIAEILDLQEQQIVSEARYRSKLMLIKRGLMHDLLTGRIRVKVPKEKNGEL